ncbi:co-chaperone GroES [candidate division WWE3 bacterium RIFOXYC1_FULL_39_7]|uniref:Co-chaperonin GroES n=2 Tax=Katanobacteria TaxID=422282 RepID=A0A1F4X4U9_UNCKA|nr:MAG: co-chaperone GroES [candidate division WWE3 bacterium RIFOXYC1_FULL_39_7]OGC76561.1 MAG: co-chaperone GroES [candidate division WWE3 bacterium RIFOXYD1_FULL_39_9]
MTTTINKVRPLSDFILIEPMEKETLLPSGIVIPDTAKEKPQEGKVISVGPGRRDDDGDRVPMEVKAGDIVMYKKWGGTEIKVEGKELLLVKEEDILAVVEG